MVLRIGLTGGIATGKSTVSRWLQQHGFQVIDTDQLAREVVLPNTLGLSTIVAHFGDGILMEDGTLNRRALGEIIFADAQERQWLNDLLHPLIFQRIESLIQLMDVQVVFIDMPLLYEVQYEKFVDQVWVIYVPRDIQIERLVVRNQWTVEQAEQVIRAQMDIEEKARLAHDVFDNQGSIEELYQQLEQRTQQW